MSRIVTIDEDGNFSVTDDPGAVIATALLVANSNVHRDHMAAALTPDGRGLHVPIVGSIKRITSREELPYGVEADATYDPEAQELWLLYREPDGSDQVAGECVLAGDELRALVARLSTLRAAQGATR